MVYSTNKATVQRGIINRYPHIGSAGKGMHVPFIPVPLYNKVNKNIQILKKKKKGKKKKAKKKKKSQLALPTNSCSSLRNPNPVEFLCEIDAHQSRCVDN